MSDTPSGKRAVALALLLALALATPAHAGGAHLRQAIRIADAHWPTSPCRGRQQVIGITPAVADAYRPGVLAYAPADGSCRVWVAWQRLAGYPTRLRCRLLVHEFGHLAGRGHSTRPASVMYPTLMDLRVNTLDCYRAFPSPVTVTDADPHWGQFLAGQPLSAIRP